MKEWLGSVWMDTTVMGKSLFPPAFVAAHCIVFPPCHVIEGLPTVCVMLFLLFHVHPGVMVCAEGRVRRTKPSAASPHAEGVQLGQGLSRHMEPLSGGHRGCSQDRWVMGIS